MKKNLLFLIPALALLFLVTSCNKSDPTPPANTSVFQGKWTGLITPAVGPRPYFAITFNTDGTVLIEQNNATTPDIARGTYTVSGNNVNATYTFSGATTGTYSLAAIYSSSPVQISGTIGTGTSTTGYGTFDVSK